MLRSSLVAVGVVVVLMAVIIPTDIYLFEAVKLQNTQQGDHMLDVETANRNFIGAIINQGLNIIAIAISVLILGLFVRYVKDGHIK